MYKRSISLLCLAMVFFSLLVPAYAANIQAPDNFANWSSEERAAWLEENVQPNPEDFQPGIQPRIGEWIYASKTTKYIDGAGVELGTLSTEGRWKIDGAGNVIEYEKVRLVFTAAGSAIDIDGNDQYYAYLPHPTMCRMTFETRFLDAIAGESCYYAHVYFLSGDGTYTVQVIQ